MSDHRYIDIHVIQTVPPSNLNRDDAGSPKQAMYGGVRRARVSSQSWKRATRRRFDETTPPLEQGTRTQRIAAVLSSRLRARSGIDADAAERIAAALLKPLKITDGKKAGNTAYLLFFGRAQIERLIDEVEPLLPEVAPLEGKDLEEALSGVSVQDHLMEGHPIDVALFGRMVADLPQINVDAAVQVAHALSTHPVDTEFDYFTAVDDEKARNKETEDLGAGMIGTVEFNSATLYRYATVGLHQLVENLGGDREAAVAALGRFVEGFVKSMPTGHQNAFAHRTLPDAVIVVVRDDQPVNLVSAFERPVRGAGLSDRSIVCLAEELAHAEANWGARGSSVLATYPALEGIADDEAAVVSAAFGDSRPFAELVEGLVATLAGSDAPA